MVTRKEFIKEFKEMLDDGYILFYNDEAYIPSWRGEDAVNVIKENMNQFTLKELINLLEGKEVDVSFDFITGIVTGYFQLIKENEW